MRNVTTLGTTIALLSVGCASDLSRRLDTIEARLAAVEAKPASLAPPKSLNELVKSAGVARARREMIVTNLANAETNGFKRRKIDADAAVVLDMAQGPMQNTDRPLDVAINGPGFFRVKTNDAVGDGTAYTRNGNFFLNNVGELVLGAKAGPRLLPTITLPNSVLDIHIADDGTVEAVTADNKTTPVGRLELVRFVNAEGLAPLDSSLFLETTESGPPIVGTPSNVGFGSIQQDFLEASNVDPLAERVRLADVERSLEGVERTLARYESPTSSPARPPR